MEGMGERLRELRGKRTQAEIASAIGVKSVTYATYENEQRDPTYKTLLKLADLHGVTTDYLLGRTDCKSPDIEIQGICEKTGLSEKSVERLIGLRNRDPRSIHDEIDDRIFPDLLFDAVTDFISLRIESFATLQLAVTSFEAAFMEAENQRIMSNYRYAYRSADRVVRRKNYPFITQWMSSPISRKESLLAKMREMSNAEMRYFIQIIQETESFKAIKQEALDESNTNKELFAFRTLLHGKSDTYSPEHWE